VICDKCGKPIIPGEQPRYALADSDDGKTGRHWECHVPVERLFDDLRDALGRAERALGKLGSQTSEPPPERTSGPRTHGNRRFTRIRK
jgi:hypothetical protein